MVRSFGLIFFLVLALIGISGVAYLTRTVWLPIFSNDTDSKSVEDNDHPAPTQSDRILLTEQAQKNLKLKTAPLKPEAFWKTITVPGMIVDRPGFSDRGVVAPITGIVTRIHHFPGETVQPGETLFTIRVLSEILQQTQSDLFKATQDIRLAEEQRKRLVASSSVIPEARIIEVENQISRLQSAVKAYRQDLLNRGFTESQIESVSVGKFVTEIETKAPSPPNTDPFKKQNLDQPIPAYEIQELKVELGQQVQTGQTLCLVSNHLLLSIEGRAFRDETGMIERSVRNNWPINVDFQEDPDSSWPPFDPSLRIQYLSNSIDPTSRTFVFHIPLENQWKSIQSNESPILLWRFRPGHAVRLEIRTELLENVFILPIDAVVREGGDAYVFRQNGDTFDRRPVSVLYRDRQHIILANDGSVPPSIYVAQNGATQLNRMLKSQNNRLPKGFHIHADGTVHSNH